MCRGKFMKFMQKSCAAALIVSMLAGTADILTFTSQAAESKGTLEGKYISVMGDSISTYTGWSDSKPITSEDCKYRYGEAYYGPVGGDFHNTELVVEDTWWHQAAEELGAEILDRKSVV